MSPILPIESISTMMKKTQYFLLWIMPWRYFSLILELSISKKIWKGVHKVISKPQNQKPFICIFENGVKQYIWHCTNVAGIKPSLFFYFRNMIVCLFATHFVNPCDCIWRFCFLNKYEWQQFCHGSVNLVCMTLYFGSFAPSRSVVWVWQAGDKAHKAAVGNQPLHKMAWRASKMLPRGFCFVQLCSIVCINVLSSYCIPDTSCLMSCSE